MKLKYLLILIFIAIISWFMVPKGHSTTWSEEGGGTAQSYLNFGYFVKFTSSTQLPTGANSITGAGTGSGLDADKLDGQDGAWYLAASSGGLVTPLTQFYSSMTNVDNNFLSNSSATATYANISVTNNIGISTSTLRVDISSHTSRLEQVRIDTTTLNTTKLNISGGFMNGDLNMNSHVLYGGLVHCTDIQASTNTLAVMASSGAARADDLNAKISSSMVTLDGNQTVPSNKTYTASGTYNSNLYVSTLYPAYINPGVDGIKPGQAYGWGGSSVCALTPGSGGGSSASTKFKTKFHPGGCSLPVTQAAYLQNYQYELNASSRTRWTLAFPKGTTSYATWQFPVDADYSGGTMNLNWQWISTSAVTGVVAWQINVSSTQLNASTTGQLINTYNITQTVNSTGFNMSTTTVVLNANNFAIDADIRIDIQRNSDRSQDTCGTAGMAIYMIDAWLREN